ncbi:hypothetical protein RhiJN_19778 [Ceratobasidium sp. AG-Ba]|nr:hypothetical protein RhiJN_04947 [Ceratobasidium sp. AG-Ba]QRV91760.1 hypothetical protein RhiJN_19778 [Ceratobasidium sp. AG-Ba]
MRVNNNHATINVKNREKDEASVLSFCKRMIQNRKDYHRVVHGDLTLLSEEDERVFAYTCQHKSMSTSVVMNFGRDEVSYNIPEDDMAGGAKTTGSSIPTGQEDAKLQQGIKLEPFEDQVWLVPT